jgi:predicted enzyme related to lactoylglutathione lyase
LELATPDAEASKNFYSELLGWTWTDMPMSESMVYTMLQKGDRFVGAMFQIQQDMLAQGMYPHWVCYISTDDVDAATARVRDAGGNVINEPFDVFTAGRMSVVADPAGATFGIWQAREHIGAGLVHEPGSLGWNELYTTDIEAANAFYASVFGWERAIHQVGPEAEDYHEFTLGQAHVAGMLEIKPSWGEVTPNWGSYFSVESVDASYQKAQALGAQVVVPVMQEAEVRFCYLQDPQGVYFGLVQTTDQ